MPDASPSRPTRAARDLTQGPIAATLLAFAMPTLLSNVLQSLNGSINAIWVGRFLGEGALAATSNANLIMFLMFSAIFGFGMAATILVGQSVGRRDFDAARRAMGTVTGLFLVLSVVVAVGGWLAAPAILNLLDTPPEALPLALAYLRVIFLAMPASFLTVLLMMGLRGFGDALTPLWFMIVSAVIDSGLNPVLILGLGPAPRLGIAGAAWATVVANYVGLIGLVAAIYLRDLPVRLRGPEWRYLRPDPALLRVIAGKGFPMGLQMIVMSVSALAMIGLVNREGIATTAAYGAINQLWAYVQMPALAIGAAVSAMVAQNIGAARWDRVAKVTATGVGFNLAMTGALVLLLVLIDRQALGLFLGSGSAALPIAAHIHLVAGWSFMLFGVTLVLSASMRANGVVIAPLIIMIVAMFPVRLGLAALGQPRLGADAIWWSFPAGAIAMLAMTWGYWRFAPWRAVRLDAPVACEEAEERAFADGDACVREMPAA